tara:strand:+ start:170 stop:988 length:819 start_codon:yes stop_codon:yes gene_type:complete
MGKKFSLNIGLNKVNSSKFIGKYKQLNNAENDAFYYSEYAARKGFETNKLIGKNATSDSFFSTLNKFSKSLNTNDILFVSYAGHGTRVEDLNDDEPEDDKDEAIVLYDRIVLDDELQNIWLKFKGVRIFFLTDSCVNGRVSRLMEDYSFLPHEKYIFRGTDIEESQKDIENNIGFYKSIRSISYQLSHTDEYSMIHIASCQNNQLADDGTKDDRESFLTGVFRKNIDLTNFTGSYKGAFQVLKNNMPPWQTPDWDNHNVNKTNNFEKSQFMD